MKRPYYPIIYIRGYAMTQSAVEDTVAAQMKATLTALQALQRQVEMLNEKVDKLMENK